MDKNAIKKFAVDARKQLINSVKDKAGMLGITANGCDNPVEKGEKDDYEIYKTIAGTDHKIFSAEMEKRKTLVERIDAVGYDTVIEEVAYTWFNRLIAIRYMEVNDYLPTRVRVISSASGKTEPDIVTVAPDIDFNFSDADREEIYLSLIHI